MFRDRDSRFSRLYRGARIGMANDDETALFDDLTGCSAARPPAEGDNAAGVAMLQVIKGDSTLR